MWEKPIVRKHETSNDKVIEKSNLNPWHRFDWDVLIEFGGSCVELKKEPFVDPVQDEVEDTGEWIQNRQAGGVHQHTPQVGVVLRVNVMASNLITCVQPIQILLDEFLGVDVDIVIIIIILFLPDLLLAASVAAPDAKLG